MEFNYKLIRSRRRTVCLEIRNGELVIRAPILAPQKIIEGFIKSKRDWIAKRLVKSQKIFKRQYKEGEPFFYLGNEVPLRIIKTNLKHPEVQLENNQLVILTSDIAKHILKEALTEFYKNQAEKIISKILKKHENKFGTYGKVKVKDYKSKWGSCTSRNNLSFSAKLAMAPRDVIEYVVLHELSHIEQKNHSKTFWSLVKSVDDKYNEKRKWLKINHHKLVL